MEANELMIGDFVLDGNVYAQVTSITCDGNIETTHNEHSNIELIEPIPLTPEILEKNSFYYGYTRNEENLAFNTNEKLSEGNKGWCFDEGCGAIKVMFPNETDCGMLVIDDQSFDRHLDFVYSATIHVHELQHTLRLCGIEKEIVL